VLRDPGSTNPLSSPSLEIIRPFGDEPEKVDSDVFGVEKDLTLQIEIASSELGPELQALFDALGDSDVELSAKLTIKRG
jgi:hypothetical protein